MTSDYKVLRKSGQIRQKGRLCSLNASLSLFSPVGRAASPCNNYGFVAPTAPITNHLNHSHRERSEHIIVKDDLMNQQDRKELFLLALDTLRGNVLRACETVNMARQTYYNWREQDEEFDARCNSVRLSTIDERLDRAEEALDNNVESGVSSDIKYFLDNHGGARGYGKKAKVTVTIGQDFDKLSFPDVPDDVDAWESATEQSQKELNPTQPEGVGGQDAPRSDHISPRDKPVGAKQGDPKQKPENEKEGDPEAD